MKTEAIVPGRIELSDEGVPRSAAYGDIYHPKAGALVQARHVFLAGNELPQRWHGRDRFVVLETGFGLGNNFLATWLAWRADPGRSDRLSFVSVERHPLTRADLAALPRDAELAGLGAALVSAWPTLTPNLHRRTFDGGRVELLLAFGDVQSWLPELRLQVDAFFLDGFAPACNPRMWDLRVCKALGRLAAEGATLATWTASSAVRAGLTTAGFDVRLAPGTGGKRDILLGRHAPGFTPRQSVAGRSGSRTPTATDEQRALIIGAGLAGCATAWALSERGWRSALIERHPLIAQESSGNPAGLFHGIVNEPDGVHARLLRAAALEVHSAVTTAIAHHGVAGAASGLLRLETALCLPEMEASLARLGLAAGYVQARSAADVSRLNGLPPGSPAWYYPAGGWVDPAGLARSYVERAGDRVSLRTGVAVQSLRRAGALWQALDASGTVIDAAEVVVLANAGDARRLLGDGATASLQLEWRSTRGQLSVLPAAQVPAALADCRLPMAGAGYLIPLRGGSVLFGATSQPDDSEPDVRRLDHLSNLEQLRRLTGLSLDSVRPESLTGRTAWRWSTADRLPLVGAVPALSPASSVPALPLPALFLPALPGNAKAGANVGPRRDAARSIAREPGLYLYSALGSRGIVWSALCAQVLAAAICGSPLPLEASLLAAIDPARFGTRALRRRIDDRQSGAGPKSGSATAAQVTG